MRGFIMAIIGVICGIAWWAISLAFGAEGYGIVGRNPLTGLVAGALTGLAAATLSIPIYRRASQKGLILYSVLSVYLAIAVYGAIILVFRLLSNDFPPNQIHWATGVQSVLGMWWGTTFLVQVAIPIHLLAYANHRALRSILIGGQAGRMVGPAPTAP